MTLLLDAHVLLYSFNEMPNGRVKPGHCHEIH
jgi:hypothetical protein